MVMKHSVFDISFASDAKGGQGGRFPAGNLPLERKSFNVQGHPLQNEAAPTHCGPVASAEAAIRAENDALAHEHLRLKTLGLITALIDTSAVVVGKLTRDRSANADPELAELKDSIQAVGLSNPIRVEQTEAGFELIQGFRRLAAFKQLAAETGDPRYNSIPAALVPRGEPLVDLYRKMVDENLVRKDISFGEMATLALSYARDEGIESGDAVTQLYASALKQKRTYIRQFARVLDQLGGAVKHPEAIPRALGVDPCKLFETEPVRAEDLAARLAATPSRSAAEEVSLLRKALEQAPKGQGEAPESVSKTSLRLARPEGEARVIAQDGRVELRLPRDFSAVSREKLRQAVEIFLTTLDE